MQAVGIDWMQTYTGRRFYPLHREPPTWLASLDRGRCLGARLLGVRGAPSRLSVAAIGRVLRVAADDVPAWGLLMKLCSGSGGPPEFVYVRGHLAGVRCPACGLASCAHVRPSDLLRDGKWLVRRHFPAAIVFAGRRPHRRSEGRP